MNLCGSAFTVPTRVRETLFPVRSVRRSTGQGFPEDGGFRYILVIMDDLSNFVLMAPVEVCNAEATAASLLTWCNTLGVPRV